MFLRGQGGNSAALGVAQDDAIRNITGAFNGYHTFEHNNWASSPSVNAFALGGVSGTTAGGPVLTRVWAFDASRVVPTAPENRPVNTAVRYLIRAAS